jgi:hypothetical protein
MAVTTIATTDDLANELETLAKDVAFDAHLMDQVDSVLCAIMDGELLAATPAEGGDRARHNAAVHLLDDLQQRFRNREERPGTDPWISLDVLARDVRQRRLVVSRSKEAGQ